MPDAIGLDADLVLAIDRALSDVDRIEAALAAATTGVVVTLDTSGVEDALAAALVAGAAAPVVLEADTAEIPSSIEEAVAGITPDVAVGADTSTAETEIGSLADQPPVDVPVDAQIDAAEQSIASLADQPPVEIPVDANVDAAQAEIQQLAASIPPVQLDVEADLTGVTQQVSDLGSESSSASGGVDGLSGSVTGLGVAAGITEGSAKELLGSIGDLGGEGSSVAKAAGGVAVLATATAGFFTEGMNAVSAGQRFDMVLGDMADKINHIDVNGLNTSMQDLGISFGSTEADMENVNSKLYQNAVNAGISKDKAVEFAQQIDTLAARAIALNPQLGNLDDVAGSLGDKLARGGRFAQNYGIQLTAVEINTRAMADTGKTAAGDLTVVEKSIAGAELASEKYGSTLAGTVAEGQKNAANQAKELKARFQEAIEQIGVPLVSPILDLIKQAEPDAQLIAEDLGRLAKDALPAVAAALDVIGPPLQLVQQVLDAIPDPVITGTIAFLGLNAALEGLSARIAGVEAETAVFMPEIAIAAGVLAAAVAVFSSFGDSAPYVDNVTKAIDGAVKGFDDYDNSVRKVIKDEAEAAAAADNFAATLNKAGVSTDDVTTSLIVGGDSWNNLKKQVIDASGGLSLFNFAADKANADLDHMRQATEDAAQRQLDKAVADKLLSQADADAAIAAAGLVDGQKNYAAALDAVQPKIQATKDATEKQAAADKAAKDAADAHAASMHDIETSNQAVYMTLVSVQQSTGDTTSQLEGLAVALNNANLQSKDFDTVAGELGVTTDQLKGFIAAVKSQVDDFVNTAVKGLPTVSDAIDAVLNPKKEPPKAIIIDPVALQNEIDNDINKINAFNLQLAFLTQHGLDNLAQIASEKGPEFTDALVTQIQQGGDEMGQTLDAKFGDLHTLVRDEPNKLREAGTGIVTATGDIGADASAAFGDKFQLGGPTSDALGGAQGEIDGWAHGLAGSAQTTGATAAGPDGFAGGIGKVTSAVTDTMNTAANVLTNTDTLSGLVTAAYSGGKLVGAALDDGMSTGIDKNVNEVVASASAATQAGIDAAKNTAGVHSPSAVFAAIGGDIAAGLAQGIDDGSDVAAIAAASMATKTAQSAEDAAAAAYSKATTEVQDNLYQLGLESADEYIAQLRARLGGLIPLSQEWTQVLLKIEQVQTDVTRQQDQAAKDAAAAAQKQAQAAAAVAQDHQRIHDVMFQVGDIDANAYLDMLNQRMAKEEEAGQKYSAAWKAAYDEAQRVKDDLAKAQLDKPFVDLGNALGVSTDKIHTFVDKMNQAIDSVVNDAKNSLPSIGSILQQSLDSSGVLDAGKFQTNLDAQIEQVQQYTANVDKLMAQGLTRTAQLAIQQGPAAAAALATAGSATLEASLGKFDEAQQAVADKAKMEWGPKIADGLGETGQLAGEAFGKQFTQKLLDELDDSTSVIRKKLDDILGISGPAVSPALGAPGGSVTMEPKIPAIASALPAPYAAGQLAAVKAAIGQIGPIHVDAPNLTAAEAETMGQKIGDSIGQRVSEHLAGVL